MTIDDRGGAEATSGRAPEAKVRILNRLKRLEGQVRGLQRMVEDDRACHEVLTLYSGIRSALDATADLVLEEYVRACQDDAAAGRDRIGEVVKAVKLARG